MVTACFPPSNVLNAKLQITSSNSFSPTDRYAANFSITWQYPPGPASEPVHAFPNAKLELNDTLPAQISNIKTMPIDVAWTYAPGSSIQTSTNNADLAAANVNANVAVDLFIAESESKASSTTEADYEVMVWLGRWGSSTQPIGLLKGSLATETVNGTTFDLYAGRNGLGQRVFTWVAAQNTTEFVGDIYPLVDKLADNAGPDDSAYLGYFAFGSEALYSFENVTFSCPRLELDVMLKSG
jgi:hypothetical protein